jgi:hypothetical protein
MQAKIRFRTTVGETGMEQPTDGTADSRACRAIFGAKSLGRCDVTCNGSHGGHLPNREIEPPPIFSEITTVSTLGQEPVPFKSQTRRLLPSDLAPSPDQRACFEPLPSVPLTDCGDLTTCNTTGA